MSSENYIPSVPESPQKNHKLDSILRLFFGEEENTDSDNSSMGTAFFTSNGQIYQKNTAFSQIVSKFFHESLIHPDDLDIFKFHIIGQGKNIQSNYKLRIQVPSGKYHEFRIHATPMRDHKIYLGTLSIFTDITGKPQQNAFHHQLE